MSRPRRKKNRADDFDAEELGRKVSRLAKSVSLGVEIKLAETVLAGLIEIAETREDKALEAVCSYLCARDGLFKVFREYLELEILKP